MPQEHYVLRCFSCEIFQAHIVKKSKKWECKMCGAKQSVKRNYGKGSGKDCRNQVMKLNELRSMHDSKANCLDVSDHEEVEDLPLQQDNEDFKQFKPFVSKWTRYLEEPQMDSESEGDECEQDFCAITKKKNKKRVRSKTENCTNSNKKICRGSNLDETSSAIKISYVSQTFNQENSHEISKTYERVTKNNNSVQTINSKVSKYTKYLEDEEENKIDLTKVNKSSSIFDSGTSNLDNILTL